MAWPAVRSGWAWSSAKTGAAPMPRQRAVASREVLKAFMGFLLANVWGVDLAASLRAGSLSLSTAREAWGEVGPGFRNAD